MADASRDDTASTRRTRRPTKLLVPLVLLAVGMYAGRTLLRSAAPATAEQRAAEAAAARAEVDHTCEVANAATRGAAGDGPAGAPADAHAAGTDDRDEAADSAPDADAEVATDGPVLELEPMTLNLADGRYLRVGLGLQLPPGADPVAFDEEGRGAQAADLAITTFGHYTMDELVAPDTRAAVKHDLGVDVCRTYDAEILTVYFTEFVMQ